MAKVNVVGAFTGAMHAFATRVFYDGRSLHPLQRTGQINHTGYPSLGTPLTAFDNAPAAADSNLGLPPVLDNSITTALRTATMV